MPHFAALGAYIIAYIKVLVPNGVYLTPNSIKLAAFPPVLAPICSHGILLDPKIIGFLQYPAWIWLKVLGNKQCKTGKLSKRSIFLMNVGL
jgi:hypothetical protein